MWKQTSKHRLGTKPKKKKEKKGKITVFLPYFDDNNVDETPKNPLQQWR